MIESVSIPIESFLHSTNHGLFRVIFVEFVHILAQVDCESVDGGDVKSNSPTTTQPGMSVDVVMVSQWVYNNKLKGGYGGI